MPCEDCRSQFTVFKRKRRCSECKRYYCNNCISETKEHHHCQRCVIFNRRPLKREHLLVLKPKDLIFYLQSKHISTSGCVEKDELVSLVLNHVQSIESASANSQQQHSPNNGSSRHENFADNPFDNIKQSCQNFFTTISDNISDTLGGFDAKVSTARRKSRDGSDKRSRKYPSMQEDHIYEQPRPTRVMPSYASAQQQQQQQQHSNVSTPTAVGSTPSMDSSSNQATVITEARANDSAKHIGSEPRTCNCSEEEAGEHEEDDEEIIATFTRQSSLVNASPSNHHLDVVGTQDDYSHSSSFEELGAIGGISDDSRTATDTNSSSNTDQWQIVDNNAATSSGTADNANSSSSSGSKYTQAVCNEHNDKNTQTQLSAQLEGTLPASKKLTRRRSDGYLNRIQLKDKQHSSTDESITSPVNPIAASAVLLEQIELGNNATQTQEFAGNTANTFCCRSCGKHKTTLRRRIQKMRQHLESSHMTEADIKRELQHFLVFLEQRTKSFGSDSETATVLSSSVSGNVSAQAAFSTPSPTPDTTSTNNTAENVAAAFNAGAAAAAIINALNFAQHSQPTFEFDENEGIFVYGSQPASNATANNVDAAAAAAGSETTRFINIENFETSEELAQLSVKQLKEILMLNRVDYKGCCEKQELLDRVVRLWNTHKTTPAPSKLPTDELCKVCMDAPIECVILECGHMATCTNCGKVLSECPICRQYIVRVVRIFKA